MKPVPVAPQGSVLQGSVLIVSNDFAVIQAVQRCLPRGYRSTVAQDAQGALQHLGLAKFDLVVGEMRMPERGGIEWLDRMRLAAPQAGVLMIFSRHDWVLALEAMRRGAYDCLENPGSDPVWRARLEMACARRRRETDQLLIQGLLEAALQDRTEQLHGALREVESSRRDTMETLVMALDKREHETHLHSLRVQAFTMVLAAQYSYPEDELTGLSYGALLHDIGKIAIPDFIILKPGPLSPDETRIMQQHPVLGHQILSRIPHLEEAAELALRHHERIDGRGYPFGLRGEEIPLGVRIFAVADALDVILSGRTYCSPRCMSEAREEILRCAGTQFDAGVVDAFLDTPEEAWFAAQKAVAGRTPSRAPLPREFARSNTASNASLLPALQF